MLLNVANEEARLAQAANINQLPGTDDRGHVEHLLISEGRTEYTHRRKKPNPSGA